MISFLLAKVRTLDWALKTNGTSYCFAKPEFIKQPDVPKCNKTKVLIRVLAKINLINLYDLIIYETTTLELYLKNY